MKKKIALIGAGLSNGILAYLLKDKFDITVFEKARGVGGRLSRSSIDRHTFDLGCQDFIFAKLLDNAIIKKAINQNVLLPWQPTFQQQGYGQSKNVAINDLAIYCGNPSMNAFVKWLFAGVIVKSQQKIIALDKSNKKVHLNTEKEGFGPFDFAVISSPAPQAIMLDNTFEKALSPVNYSSALMVNLALEKPLEKNIATVIKNESGFCRWLIQQHQKPGRELNPSLTLQSKDEDFEKIKSQQVTYQNQMIAEAKACLKNDFLIKAQKSHLWRYSKCQNPIPKPFLKNDNVAIVGDCFSINANNSTIENAIESSIALSHQMN